MRNHPSFRRFMATPIAVIALGILIVIWTWNTLGWDAAWRLALMLLTLGVVDAVLGAWSKPLSLSINQSWHRNPLRYWFWFIGMGLIMLLLHFHFTGV